MPEKIFRDYDQQELDRQLNLRARWPEHTEFIARWGRESQAVRDASPEWLELAYGDTAGQALDLFPVTSGVRSAPLFAFIHGGYWQTLDKSDFDYIAPTFLEAGIAFASLNYDLAPGAGIEEMVGQIRRCLAHLHDNAERYAIDAKRIFVAGHSAGGHLATMAAATDWPAQPGTPPHNLVKGAVSISGVYELEPLRLSYHNEVLNLDLDMTRRMSPRILQPRESAPLLAVVGAEETDEFLRQQRDFAEDWRALGLKVETLELPGLHHFSIVDDLGVSDSPLFAKVREFMDQQ
jgi:arylformamidase